MALIDLLMGFVSCLSVDAAAFAGVRGAIREVLTVLKGRLVVFEGVGGASRGWKACNLQLNKERDQEV